MPRRSGVLFGALLAGCSAESNLDPDQKPTTWEVKVETATSGPTPDADGYTLFVDGDGGRHLDPRGSITVTGLAAGGHVLGLAGVQSNCDIQGANPVELSFSGTPSAVAPVQFAVGCRGAVPGASSGFLLLTIERTSAAHVYSLKYDGTQLVDLTPTAEGSNGHWSRDGALIAFVSSRAGTATIYTMGADGSGPAPLRAGSLAVDDAVWSPDGTKLAFSIGGYEGQFGIVDATGDNPVMLGAGTGPTWSPDGLSLAISRLNLSTCIADICGRDIFDVAADGSSPGQLTRVTTAETASAPAWSPDGTRIAYVTKKFLDPVAKLMLMNADGSRPRVLTSAREIRSPVWSPDGTSLVYGSSGGGSAWEVRVRAVADSSGAGAVILTEQYVTYPTSWK